MRNGDLDKRTSAGWADDPNPGAVYNDECVYPNEINEANT